MTDEKHEKYEKHSPIPSEYEVTLNIPGRFNHEDDESVISIAGLVITLRKKIFMIIAITMIFYIIGMVAAIGYYFVTRPYLGTATALLSYGYKGVENGVDPMGRALDVSKIKSPYVIEQAMQELDLYKWGITVEDIRSNIVIEGVVPQDVMQRILIVKEIATTDPTRLETITDIQYHPTQYIVTLEHKDNLKVLPNKKLSDVVDSILDNYIQYFIKEYSSQYIFDTIADGFDQSQYDYAEVLQIFNGQINNMINYCDVKRKASPDFRSPVTQMTFGDIITNLEIIKSVDISRISALVYASNMSRDRDRLAKLYEYRITTMTMDMNTALENAAATNAIAESYQKDPLLVMNSLGDTATYSQSSGIYDSFLNEALSYTKRATSLREDITFYKERLEALKSSNYSSNTRDTKFVEEAIPSILTSLQDWADITNQTVDDYFVLDVFKDAAKIVIPAHYGGVFSDYKKNMLLIVAGITFAGLFLSILAAIWKEAFPIEK